MDVDDSVRQSVLDAKIKRGMFHGFDTFTAVVKVRMKEK